MRNETTPDLITEPIKELCESIVNNEPPIFIDVDVKDYSIENECFMNVETTILKFGGKQVNGWAIWQWANILIEAEAHSVWLSPDGRMLDITPHNYSEKRILFLPDSQLIYNNNCIPSVRRSLTNSILVQELIELNNEKDRLLCESSEDTYQLPKELIMKIFQITSVINKKVKHYELCPCRSGLKYKHCCGKFD